MNLKILVIRFSSLGDIILSSPTVLNLKIGYPQSHITFLTKHKYRPIVKMFGTVDEIAVLPKSGKFREQLSLFNYLEQQNFDIIVDLHSNFRSSLARTVLTAGQKVVYPRNRSARQRIVRFKDFSAPDSNTHTHTHTIDKYNDCLSQLGFDAPARRPVFQKSNGQILAEHLTVLIAPGAAFENKKWPVEKFAEVAVKLHHSHQAKIIWAATENDKTPAKLKEQIPEENLSILSDHPLESLASIISQATITIANDSGIAHLSSAVGTPVISIFGPTHPALGFQPRGLLDLIVQADVSCCPCSLHGDKKCFQKEQYCFTRIEPLEVVEKAGTLISVCSKMTKALFADRDGTVIVDKPFDSDPANIEFENGSIEALKKAAELGFKLIIVTNQSGVARGYFGIDKMKKFNSALEQKLAEQNIKIDAIEYCPHYPTGSVAEYSFRCDCRKPAGGMAEKAALEHNIDLRKSYVIGDKLDDLNLGRVIGARHFLVLTGQGKANSQRLPDDRE
ncbi:MAG: HAD-IIIA family hydrolase, partial [candidate division Zixibacteria bacterium]|nr:HAD-IIIA family hydrolase [candidate division Zixibacteria bacterium]